MVSTLGIRLFGELTLSYPDDRPVALPASRKTRALLGYLVATGQAHRRERLCELFWDGPDDPRAELRWSLSKLRPVLARLGARLVADRERVAVDLGAATVDLWQVRALLAGGAAQTATAALEQAAALFTGELLDGLELPACYRYQAWCMAEREAAGRLRLAVLSALVGRLEDKPAAALLHARALASADPLCEAAHVAVVRLLSREGRHREALAHFDYARRLLAAELGISHWPALDAARPDLQDVGASRGSPGVPLPEPTATGRLATTATLTVGRSRERERVDRFLARPPDQPRALLVTGEPGIGKSRLLSDAADQAIACGGQVFTVRAYEAESTRPYGVWIDLLGAHARASAPGEPPADLGSLLPGRGATTGGWSDQIRLFESVAVFLRGLATDRLVAVVIDDVQWLDEASSSLLHYVVRQLDDASRLVVLCAARAGEIADNPGASRVLRSLAHDARLLEIELGPLDASASSDLVRRVGPNLDVRPIVEEASGNPLFIVELARARLRGDADPGSSIGKVIAGHLATLSEPARETLLWAAAFGRAVAPDEIERAAPSATIDLVATFGELERRGLIRPTGESYDFTHDLVRRAGYHTLSQPRRRLMHRRIAASLGDGDNHAAGGPAEIAHHAALAQDHGRAADACVLAGRQALRLFANLEAAGFADRGLHHASQLDEGPGTVACRMSLLEIRVLAGSGPGMRPLPPLAGAIVEAAAVAERLGLQSTVATGHYLLSVLHQAAGDTTRAEHSTLRAADAVRRADDDRARAHQLANTARCLLELETEVRRARELVAEAHAIAAALAVEICELHWARGLIARWDGRLAEAADFLVAALSVARRQEERWREYKCLTWLALLERERGRFAEMETYCRELASVAGRLGENETPFVEGLRALADLAAGAPGLERLSRAVDGLREVDDKSCLAYVLDCAARLHLQAGRRGPARDCASEALAVATMLGRHDEAVIARAVLAAVGEPVAESDAVRDTVARRRRSRNDMSARAREARRSPTRRRPIPTAAST